MTEARAETHTNARLVSVVVRGFVRDDPDWEAAINDALNHADPRAGIDMAMMRAIHAAHRTDAVRDLGVQAYDSKNPIRRLVWEAYGKHRAAARAETLNEESTQLDDQLDRRSKDPAAE